MQALLSSAIEAFGADLSEKKICGETSFAVDFYFPEEQTIVEVALGLPNPNTEFEKEILKAIIAQDSGYAFRCLFFISRPGAVKKCRQPGRSTFTKWAENTHHLAIEVRELRGEPRRRRRRRRAHLTRRA